MKYDRPYRLSLLHISWQFAKGVASPIIGATKAEYFDDAAGALNIRLSDDEIAYLEEPYVPHKICLLYTSTIPKS